MLVFTSIYPADSGNCAHLLFILFKENVIIYTLTNYLIYYDIKYMGFSLE